MIKRFLWLTGSLVSLCIAIAFVFTWIASNREVLAFAEGLPDQGRLIDTSHGAFFIVEKGVPETPRVLLAHGAAAWSDIWAETQHNIAPEGYLVTAFDMPPFGWSEHPKAPTYERQAQAARMIGLLEALGDKPILVAHSVAAGPATEAVMMRPDLVSGYVIVSGAMGLADRHTPKDVPFPIQNRNVRKLATAATATNPLLTKWFLKKFMHRTDEIDPAMVASLQTPMSRQGYTQAVSDWIPQLFKTPLDSNSMDPEEWRKLDMPVVLIWGDKDTVTPLHQGQELAALLPNARLTVLNYVGHIPHLEAPKEFADALLGELKYITSISDLDSP
jgi:pimeloyl-ACP methyl ester carboxylesterase